MTTTADELETPSALTQLIELGRCSARKPTREELDHGLDALRVRITTRRVRRQKRIRLASVAAVAALSALVLLKFALPLPARNVPSVPAPTLAYQIDGGRVLEGGYLSEIGHSGVKLRFNEGSVFELEPTTRGRLRAVTQSGARIAIDSGKAAFRITPNRSRQWAVESGPFLVTVKGTVFVVSWEPSAERFELRLREGSVVVTGPVSSGTLTLRSGQRLVVDLAKSETVISDDGAEALVDKSTVAPALSVPIASPVASPNDAPGASLLPSTSRAASDAPAVDSGANWARYLAKGQWDAILADVDRIGVEVALNQASSEGLFAIADAARYRRRTDLAHQALLAERRRFPNSRRAIDAAFLLGRVEESQNGGMARAVKWYDEYLARAPSGGYAAEALGRKMIIAKTTEGRAKAVALAEEYLRRFPRGSYASAARALQQSP